MSEEKSDTAIVIETASCGDFAAIAELDRAAWSDNANSTYIPDGEHAWRIWCEHALTWIARADGNRIAGALNAFPCLDGTFCLHKVMVAKSHRGQGLGARLLDALLRELDRRGDACFLTVDPANPAAIALYRKKGFTEERFVAGYYRSNEDRLVLTRPVRTSRSQ